MSNQEYFKRKFIADPFSGQVDRNDSNLLIHYKAKEYLQLKAKSSESLSVKKKATERIGLRKKNAATHSCK